MILVDSNILLRYANAADPLYPVVDTAIAVLSGRGQQFCVVPQNIYEFWVVGTRPIAVNGLGLSISEAVVAVERIKRLFPILPDQPALFNEWQSLVVAHQCQGTVAHDARLVAAMRTHGLTQILTFNMKDFKRYPELTILNPAGL